MNELITFLLIVLLALLVASWLRFAKTKEIALREAKRFCKLRQVEMLDDTVSLKRVRLTRDTMGKLCLLRDYQVRYFDEEKQQQRVHTIKMLGLDIISSDSKDNIVNLNDFRS